VTLPLYFLFRRCWPDLPVFPASFVPVAKLETTDCDARVWVGICIQTPRFSVCVYLFYGTLAEKFKDANPGWFEKRLYCLAILTAELRLKHKSSIHSEGKI